MIKSLGLVRKCSARGFATKPDTRRLQVSIHHTSFLEEHTSFEFTEKARNQIYNYYYLTFLLQTQKMSKMLIAQFNAESTKKSGGIVVDRVHEYQGSPSIYFCMALHAWEFHDSVRRRLIYV